ncbi:MAG: hypothetical protein ONB11_05855, partial [candidate division KSB1 bacterium]|nr:hypothetical protein [candidate division KSB1 bacterium]
MDSSSHRFINFKQLKMLPLQSIQLPDHKTKETITWEGVYLKAIFQRFLNTDWEKIDGLIIKAPDGYSSVISGLRMKQAESALCAFAMKGKNWPRKFGSLRIIFPELHEMHWMNNPTEIQLILKREVAISSTWHFFFFDSPAFHSLQKNVTDDFSGWSVNEVLTAMGCANKGFTVFTHDGHLREFLFDKVAQRMKLAPDSSGTWKIRGERVPIGFRLRNIFFIYSENVGLFTKSLSPEEQQLWQQMFASIHPFMNQGIAAKDILSVLISGEKVTATNLDAYHTEEISLYQLWEREKEHRSDLLKIEVKW